MNKPPKTTIEINGKHYDARTGKPLAQAPVVATSQQTVKTHPVVSDIKRQPQVSNNIHKTVERSHTLMRHAVRKPQGSKLGSSKSVVDIMSPVKAAQPSAPALHSQQEAARMKRASHISRSNFVTKFNDVMQTSINLPGAKPRIVDAPVAKRVQPLLVQPQPIATAPVIPMPLTHAQNILAKGLQNANSHLEKPVKPSSKRQKSKHSKFMSIAAGSLAVLLLGGFFMMQNIPNLSVRYAAARAGVRASLPGYHPAGFAVNDHIQYSPGVISVNFKSNSDERAFTITQKSSSWNSEALMNNYVASASDSVQTYEDKGSTIYLYGDSNATWVNGGVWYDITGASKLNSDQLIKIATSM